MRTQIIITAFLASLIGIGAAQAQEPRDFSLLATQTVQLPGTTYSVVLNSPELQAGEPRDTAKLSMAIASWLSANFGLPTIHRMPHVAYVEKSGETAAYNSQSHTIILPVGWNGSSSFELSSFVREMVHHLHSEAGADYECTPNLANDIEKHWLAMFKTDAPHPVNAAGAGGLLSGPRCVFRQSRIGN